MKTIRNAISTLVIALLLGCSSDDPNLYELERSIYRGPGISNNESTYTPSIDPSLPKTGTNTVSTSAVTAGSSIFLKQPQTETTLTGTTTLSPNETEWTKISGPDSYTLANKNATVTTVSNLQTGTYKFQFTAYDSSKNTIGSNTVTVTIFPAGFKDHDELIFEDLDWQSFGFWYESMIIKNIFQFIPKNVNPKLYLRKNQESPWIEATFALEAEGYFFYIEKNSEESYDLWVSNNSTDNSMLQVKPSIKITY